ncbi:MAG TPA: N-formylglutamate deformylase [Steroidobacteraceae bacterium]|nr:N-formylglutamate deformylase [Steroidobacteraceae bacterium]
MMIYALHRGNSPLFVSLPHVGTELPDDQRWRYVERAIGVEDTDWHLDRLYDFVRELGASLIVPRFNRYLIDLNRPSENTPMYPGMNNTELCPTRFFTGDPLYRDDSAPDAGEVARRIERYWRPYHEALRAELDRLRELHGHAVLFDGHSIKSELPWLFDGRLPDLNLGTANGASCASSLRSALARVLAGQSRFTQVVDGRFKGGHTTRYYGDPERKVHAIQLEMCWSCYLQETAPHAWDPQRAEAVRPVLRELIETMLAWRPRD